MRRNVIRLNESQLHRVIKESVRRILREDRERPTYEDWSRFLGDNTPLFEFGDGIVYVDYDEETGCLCSGGVTNAGFHQDGEVCVPVEYGNFQRSLEAVYEKLSANHPPMDDEDEC